MLENLTDWATSVVERLGYLGVAMLVAIENVFPPIPAEVVLGLAGYTAARGDAWVLDMIIAATIGSVIGAWILYGLSAAVGPVRLRTIIIRWGRWIGFGETDLDRAEAWLDHRSRSAVLLCRCVPLIRLADRRRRCRRRRFIGGTTTACEKQRSQFQCPPVRGADTGPTVLDHAPDGRDRSDTPSAASRPRCSAP